MKKVRAIRGSKDAADAPPLGYEFDCPGCGYGHFVHVREPNHLGAKWSFNGYLSSPTFKPSIGVFMDRPEMRCHSFVTSGWIRFLPDCYHELAGQTVPLPEIDDDAV